MVAWTADSSQVTADSSQFTADGAIAAPVILVPPQNTATALGNVATFIVFATSATAYQWYRGGVAIPGATADTYVTPPTASGDNGAQFSVAVTNSQGQVVGGPATLQVVQPAALPGVMVPTGFNANFEVSQLSLYNGALLILGERQLASLTERRVAAREMNGLWARGGIVRCLEVGIWNFAVRAAQMDYDPDITTQYGFQCAYSHPPDFVRWAGVWEDPYLEVPHTRYDDTAGFLYSDLQTLYVRYVSTDQYYGLNPALWPPSFVSYVEAYFAARTALRITGSETKAKLASDYEKKALLEAKAKGAMEEPTKWLPPGNWTQSRHGLRAAKDGGSQSSLYG